MRQEMRRPIVGEFIALYKRLPCLWKMDSKDYSDRPMKIAAYSLLAKKLAELEPGANRLSVVKKINNIRSNYRKEKRKIRAAQLNGVVFEPTLWYYKLLEFLDSQDDSDIDVIDVNTLVEAQINDSSLNFDDDEEYEDKDNDDDDDDDDTHSPPSTKAKFEMALMNGSPSESGEMSSSRKRKSNNAVVDDILCTTGLDQFQDQHDAFGRSIAFKLRALPNEQRIYAEKLINEAIFEAELGNLSRSCRVQFGPMQL